MQTRTIIAVILLLALCCICGGCAFGAWALSSSTPDVDSEAAQREIQAAGPLITALEQYYLDHDRYPKSLNDLTPTYLVELPSIPGLYYVTGLGEDYSLSFHVNALIPWKCFYRPGQEWQCQTMLQ